MARQYPSEQTRRITVNDKDENTMPRATDVQVRQRERILHPLLVAVEQSVEHWARTATNGALVWEVATDYLHGMWAEWQLVYDRETWGTPDSLLRALEKLALAVSDPAVSQSIATAQVRLESYSDQPPRS